MLIATKGVAALALRLMVGLALLGCARFGSADGSWSVISLPQKPGEVRSPRALAADAAGNLYVADGEGVSSRIQKRDAQGNWSVLATQAASALAVDAVGNLYAADQGSGRIQKRDAQG